VKKKFWTGICWIATQLRTTPQQQLKLNGESAKNIMTTFAFPYVSYLLYDRSHTDLVADLDPDPKPLYKVKENNFEDLIFG